LARFKFIKAYHLYKSFVSSLKELLQSLYPVETQDTQRQLTKGLALCRRTETQFSTLVHVAAVVPSLTDIAEQQNLTSTN
jgi:hypothetical protein